MMISVKVLRCDPTVDASPHFETYLVPYTERMRVLDALNYIHEHLDGTLAYRWVCRAAQCGSCTVMVNGRPGPACKTEVPRVAEELVIEPLRNFPVIKDLVVDADGALGRFEAIRPYVERGESAPRPERLMPADVEELKPLRSCIECLGCLAACPVVTEISDEYLGPMGLRKLAELSQDRRDSVDRVSSALAQGVYSCTTCKSCWAVCPQEIRVPEKAVEKLRAMALRRGAPLPPHKVAIASIRNYWNPWMAPRAQRAKWSKPFALPARCETMFFAGCSPSLLKQDLTEGVARIFQAMGEPLGYLGKEERCCSSPLLRVGEVGMFEEMARANIDSMRRAGAERVVVTCAGCYKAWKEDYVEHFGDLGFEVLHISQVLEGAISSGRLRLKAVPENERVVTYHDPCHLGRAGGIYEEPRKVLSSVPGMKVVEMRLNRADSVCCGSGGGVKTARPALATSIGARRVDMIGETNAQEVVSCCPWCEQNLEDSIKASGSKAYRVRDMVAIVCAALE
jgi:fumarate reductase (CoM/CoB) subunit B